MTVSEHASAGSETAVNLAQRKLNYIISLLINHRKTVLVLLSLPFVLVVGFVLGLVSMCGVGVRAWCRKRL